MIVIIKYYDVLITRLYNYYFIVKLYETQAESKCNILEKS